MFWTVHTYKYKRLDTYRCKYPNASILPLGYSCSFYLGMSRLSPATLVARWPLSFTAIRLGSVRRAPPPCWMCLSHSTGRRFFQTLEERKSIKQFGFLGGFGGFKECVLKGNHLRLRTLGTQVGNHFGWVSYTILRFSRKVRNISEKEKPCMKILSWPTCHLLFSGKHGLQK